MSTPWENIATEQEDIPEDVLMIILSKLPPKSLVRFMSVSRSWSNTITHPQFAALFDYNVAAMRDPNNTFLVIGADAGAKSTATVPMIAAKITFDMKTQAGLQVSYDKNYAPLRLRFEYREARVVGACYGVICVAADSSGEAVLWNPATGEEKWLKPGISADEILSYMGLASVKDEKNNVVDFKLLVRQKNLLENSQKFLIYSLNSNSWRLIKHPDYLNNHYIHTVQSGGVYLNGVLHWLMQNGRIDDYILTFEVATETFGKIMLPVMESGSLPDLLTLVDDKNLAVVEHKTCKRLYVWVMRRYGDIQSWAKRHYMNMWHMKGYYKSPVGYLDHFGGILLLDCLFSTLSLHINGEVIKVDLEISGKLELVQYKESVVSLKRIIAAEGGNSYTDICVA